MYNSREMFDLVSQHQRDIRAQVEEANLAANAAPLPLAHQPRYAILLAALGATLIRIGQALQDRYACVCETVTSQELPLIEDGVRLRV